MAALGPLGFAFPLALFALLILPLAAWLLRTLPPAPKRQTFPPFALLERLKPTEETPDRTPWPLVALRLTILACFVLAASGPVWRPATPAATPGPLALVVDDGWAAAADWDRVRADARRVLAEAEAARRPVRLVFTTPDASGRVEAADLDAAAARARLDRHAPRPWNPDRRAALAALGEERAGRVVWLSDGIDDGFGGELARALAARGPTEIRPPSSAVVALTSAVASDAGIEVVGTRAPTGSAETVSLVLEDARGGAITRKRLAIAAGRERFATTLAAPRSDLNRGVRVRVEGVRSAGAVRLLTGAARRPSVGVVTDPLARSQPLAFGAFYISRALEGRADLTEGSLATALRARPSVLILPEGAVARADLPALENHVRTGGVLVRFAGPALLARGDPLLPAPLAARPVAYDGALSQSPPRALRYATSGPLRGLPQAPDGRVRRLAVIAPGEAEPEVWARLGDGRPLVVARRLDQGWTVLVMTAATPDASDWPLTGAFPALLERLAGLSLQAAPDAVGPAASGPLKPVRLLDGYGGWREPGPGDPAAVEPSGPAGPARPPGLYAQGRTEVALDTVAPETVLRPLAVPPELRAPEAAETAPVRLAGLFWLLALAGLAVELFASRLAARGALALVAGLVLIGTPPDAVAQTPSRSGPAAEAPSGDTVLAYVAGGDPTRDAVRAEGLEALAATLRRRTSTEVAPVLAVDPARDGLGRVTLLYWRVEASTPRPSAAAERRLLAFVRGGGLLVLDAEPGAAGQGALRRVTAGLGLPALRPLGPDHALSRSFYRLPASDRVWVAAPEGESVDGVSPVVVGQGDWAAAWAGRVPDPRGREAALRLGVNLTLYALTGTYKTDQAHARGLIERGLRR